MDTNVFEKDANLAFFNYVNELIEENKLSKASFESISHLSNGTYNKWRNGSKPTIESVVKVAKAFGKSTDYLLGLCETNQPNEKIENIRLLDGSNSNLGASIDIPVNKYVPWMPLYSIPKEFFTVEKDNPLYGTSDRHIEGYIFEDEEEDCKYFFFCKFDKNPNDFKRQFYFFWYNEGFPFFYIEMSQILLERFFEYLHNKFAIEQREIYISRRKR